MGLATTGLQLGMADFLKDSLAQLMKRFRCFLSVKIFNDSRSIGAFAGIAFAVLFAWKLFRSSSRNQKKQPKPPTDGPSTSSSRSSNAATAAVEAAATTMTTACNPLPIDSRAQNVSDSVSQRVTPMPMLGKIVKQRLNRARKVTCQLLGVILEEASPEELQKKATVRSSVRGVLHEISKCCDLYLMERVLDDESEVNVLLALEEAGLFTSSGLMKDKVLFCSMEIGRTSFVRQLDPEWHIDTNPEIITQLSRFIKNLLHISPTKVEGLAGNVFSSTTLEQFFGCA